MTACKHAIGTCQKSGTTASSVVHQFRLCEAFCHFGCILASFLTCLHRFEVLDGPQRCA
jgi:hypothetical protein